MTGPCKRTQPGPEYRKRGTYHMETGSPKTIRDYSLASNVETDHRGTHYSYKTGKLDY